MRSTTVAITLALCVSLGNGKPNEEANFSSSSQSSSSADGYSVSMSQIDDNGKCIATMKISGNGIDKIVKYPCDETPQSIININKKLQVGDYYADSRGELVHMTGDKCVKEVFHEEGGKVQESKVEPMDEKECEEVKKKIENLKEEYKKWNEWMMKQQEETQQQMQQLQNNLQDLFGGLFGK